MALGKLAWTTGKYISDLEQGKPGEIAVLAKTAAVIEVPLEQVYRKDPKGGRLVKQTVIEINGCVETKLSHDQWLDTAR